MNFLALFMKSPQSGSGKRRLRPVLSEEEIVQLCEAFIEDLLEKLSAFPCDRKVVAYAGAVPSTVPGRLSFSLYAQAEGDLGERLEDYFRWSFSEGATKSVVIGSDSPTLPFRYLEEAFGFLDRRDVVLGPSEDGGYYLVGMRRFLPSLFQGIPWGTEKVFAETMKRLDPSAVGVLKRWYDVDTPQDLERLREELARMTKDRGEEIPRKTHRVLSELLF